MQIEERENLIRKLDEIVWKFNLPKIEKFIKFPLFTIKTSIISRLLHNLLRDKVAVKSKVKVFWNTNLWITFPPYYDIYFYNAYVDGDHEVRTTKFFIKNLGNGDIFFDIGAHQGYYTVLASFLVGKNGRVVAFEPNPIAYDILLMNKRENVILMNYAISDKDGITEFFSVNTVSCLSSLMKNRADEIKRNLKLKTSKIEVKTMQLDSFVEKFKIIPNYVKIDVEGAEFFVIKGAKNLLRRHGPTIIMEIWVDTFEETHKEAVEMIFREGYKAYSINNKGELIAVEDLRNYLDIIKLKDTVLDKKQLENLVFVKS